MKYTRIAPVQHLYTLALFFLCVSLVLSSCSLSDDTVSATPASNQPVLAPVVYPHRSHQTIDMWLENTSSYPRSDFHEAAQAFANAIDQAVVLNSDGLDVTVSLITGNSYDPNNTVLTIAVPAIAAPVPPVLSHTENPYVDAQKNKRALVSYQQQLTAAKETLAQVQSRVRSQTDLIRRLDPPVDTSGREDLWGMFNRAAAHLQAGNDQKFLLIGGTLHNDTWQEFISGDTLPNVHMRVYWHYCTDAPECQQNTDFWLGAFQHAHAADARIFDPAQSRAHLKSLLS